MAFTFNNCPPGWKVKTIEDVFEVIRGVSFPTSAKTEKADEYVGCLRTANVQKEIVWDDLWHVPIKYMRDDTKLVREHDIIISIANSLNLLGKTSYVRCVPEKSTFGTFVANLRAKEDRPKYLYYFLQSRLFLDQVVANASTTTNISNISTAKLKNLCVLIPDLAEQDRIITKIEELLSQLDEGVETLKKTQAQLDVYRQAVLVDAFCGGYPKVPLSTISKPLSGYAFKSKKYTPDGKYVVVKIGNVKSFHFDFSRDLTKTNESEGNILDKYLLQKGDCLITLTGSRGKRDYGFVAMITDQENYLLNQRVAALRFKTDIALPEFYQYYLSSPEYRNQFFSYETGNVGQGNVGIKALTDPLAVLPPIEKQREIITDIEARLTMCDNIEQTVDVALQQAEAMRQSILKQAFEGAL